MTADAAHDEVAGIADELLRLAGKATPGPWTLGWHWNNHGQPIEKWTKSTDPQHIKGAGDKDVVSGYDDWGCVGIERADDAAFIAYCREAAPALAREVQRLRALPREPSDAELTALRKFWHALSGDLCDFWDSSDVQDAAEKAGLITPVAYDPAIHGESDAEAGDRIYVKVKWPAPSPPPLLALVREWAEAGGDPALRATSERMRSPPGRVNAVLRLQRAEEALRRAAGGGA